MLVTGDLFTLNQSNVGQVREGDNQQIEMWIDKGGLRMTTTEFVSLTDLLGVALQQLSRLRTTLQPMASRSVGFRRKNSLN